MTLASPRLLYAGHSADIVFGGWGLDGLGLLLRLRLEPAEDSTGSAIGEAKVYNCSAASGGATLSCPGVVLPECAGTLDEFNSCNYTTALAPERDDHWGGFLYQHLKL
jgi:hypothetical protein